MANWSTHKHGIKKYTGTISGSAGLEINANFITIANFLDTVSLVSDLTSHTSDTSNPHSVTAAQISFTSDEDVLSAATTDLQAAWDEWLALADQNDGWPQLNADGELEADGIVNLSNTTGQLASVVLAEGQLATATDTGKVAMGDGSTAFVNLPDLNIPQSQKPAGMVRMVSVSESTINGNAKSTTGYIGVRWWDGTVQIVGDGVAGNSQSWSKAVPSWSSAWSGHAPKEVYLWSATGAADPTQSGDLTDLLCVFNSLTSLDVSGLTALTGLFCGFNSLTSLDVSGLTALTWLNCYSNSLTSLDVSGLTALTGLTCGFNSLTSLDVIGLTALTDLDCSGNSITSLDVSGLTALTDLDCSGNSLTSLIAVDVVLSYSYSFSGGGSDISDNSLDTAALDQFYTDLAEDVSENGIIDVDGNPGTTGDDPSIATAKGYTIIGS